MVFPPRRAPPHAALVAGARRAAPELDDKDGAAAARDAAHRVGLVRREDEHVASLKVVLRVDGRLAPPRRRRREASAREVARAAEHHVGGEERAVVAVAGADLPLAAAVLMELDCPRTHRPVHRVAGRATTRPAAVCRGVALARRARGAEARPGNALQVVDCVQTPPLDVDPSHLLVDSLHDGVHRRRQAAGLEVEREAGVWVARAMIAGGYLEHTNLGRAEEGGQPHNRGMLCVRRV
mmetsp:Transcript_26850/g.89389  ORF Transcript_26850/g.89389 Transcript_26850/m.89389 type:complete len:238 (-) Transcript_26850:176-889(-)